MLWGVSRTLYSQVVPGKTALPELVGRPGVFIRRYWWALLVLLAGATVDGITTYNTVSVYGAEAEVHSVGQWMFHTLGPGVGVPLAKALQCVAAVLVAAWWRPWCPWLLSACGVLYGLAALSNHFMWL
jgi:hypothetical protein